MSNYYYTHLVTFNDDDILSFLLGNLIIIPCPHIHVTHLSSATPTLHFHDVKDRQLIQKNRVYLPCSTRIIFSSSDGHVTLDGVVADEEVEDEAAVDTGEHPPRHHVDLFHLDIGALLDISSGRPSELIRDKQGCRTDHDAGLTW
jgi:hypothetical protein